MACNSSMKASSAAVAGRTEGTRAEAAGTAADAAEGAETRVMTMIQNGMRRTIPAPERAPLRKTAYGRRVTSKTFTILGASTPEIRLAPQGLRVKRKVMGDTPNL
jgi:hypothetical protein